MKLIIEGGRKAQKRAIVEMAPWVVKKLLPRCHKEIELTISIISRKDMEDCEGSCEPDPDYVATNRPRHFLICISSNLKMLNFRTVFCHEMVHLKQFAKGELYHYAKRDMTKWKDKIYSDINIDEIYWNLPFEEECRGKELGLYHQWRLWRRKQHK